MKQKDIPYMISILLMRELPAERITIENCEKLLNQALEILKAIPLNSSKQQDEQQDNVIHIYQLNFQQKE